MSRPRSLRARKKTARENAEIGFIGKALRGLGGLSGSTLGAMIGQPNAGAAVGTSLGAAVSKWLGAGDYEVSKNSLVARASANIPDMHKNDQSVVIRHKEFLGPITGSVNYTVQREFVINPGLSASFPWLSTIASAFQQYEIRGMMYHYIPTSGSAVSSTSSALGSVMIQTSYRSTEVAPASKVELLNEYWSNEVVPFETMVHPIECDPKENPFAVHYVRSGNISSGEPLLYDVGRTYVATQGMQSAYIVGDLWVTYEIVLKKPMVSSNVTTLAGYYAARFASPSTTSYFSGTSSTPLGNLPLSLTGRVLTIPQGLAGNFIIALRIFGSMVGANSTSIPGPCDLTNCTLTTLLSGGGSDQQSQRWETNNIGTSVTSTNIIYELSVIKTDLATAATVQFPTAVWNSGTAEFCYISVTNLGLE